MPQEEKTLKNFNPDLEDVKKEILEHCQTPRSKEAILAFIQVEPRPYNFKKYITALVEGRYLEYTIPGNVRHVKQMYYCTKKGQLYLKTIE
jgi:hypothetical protein